MPKSTKGKTNAIEILKNDHQTVKDLFEQYEDTDESAAKEKIAHQAIKELKIHALIEEEIFYPAVREEIEDDENIMNEAEEEHHVAKMLIAELDSMTFDDHYDAKFVVLSEAVRHHIKEEEGDMLPEAKKTDIDFEALGTQMLERKQQLEENGIPASEEEERLAGVQS